MADTAKRGADGFYALRLSTLLHMPFQKWDAYKRGIIDKDGKKLRDAESSEKGSWTMFHVTVANIKKMVNMLPGGRTALDYGASYLLMIEIKDHYNLSDEFINELRSLEESMVAGDAGDGSGSAESIATGETTGAITNAGAGATAKPKKKKKKKLKKFRHFD
ncbi:hypothetical protein VPHD480_0054 [Vibrio phage D480]